MIIYLFYALICDIHVLRFSGIYLTCTMAITTLSMVLTVFVLNLHHISDRPIPRWVRTLVLVWMARLLCMCSYDPSTAEATAPEEGRKKDKFRVNQNSLGKAIGNQIGLLASLNGTVGVSNSRATNADRARYNNPDRHNVHYSSQYTYGPEKKSAPDPKRLEEEWARDWRRLAEVVDRLLFWTFLSATVITTLILFHPLTKTYFSLLGDESVLVNEHEDDGKHTGLQIADTT